MAISFIAGAAIDIEEIACEEASAKLIECCDDFELRARSCNADFGSGCGEPDSDVPWIRKHETQCILQRKCSQLEAEGICARAQAALDPDELDAIFKESLENGTTAEIPKREVICKK